MSFVSFSRHVAWLRFAAPRALKCCRAIGVPFVRQWRRPQLHHSTSHSDSPAPYPFYCVMDNGWIKALTRGPKVRTKRKKYTSSILKSFSPNVFRVGKSCRPTVTVPILIFERIQCLWLWKISETCHLTQSALGSTSVPGKWHVNPSKGLSRVR